jgi:hypothetical protein
MNYYYGNLKDATVSAGDLTYETQYPVANINVISDKVYSQINDNGTTTAPAVTHTFDLLKIDFGSATAATGAVLDLSSFRIQLVAAEYITSYAFILYRSSDDATYTEVETLGTETVGWSISDVTHTEVYAATFTEVEYRYYKVSLVVTTDAGDDLTWDVDGNINNCFVGDIAKLNCPELIPELLDHGTIISTSYGGTRWGMDNAGQRIVRTFIHFNSSETEKTAAKAMDLTTGGGTYPVYIELTGIIDPVLVRLIGPVRIQPTASQNYSIEITAEEEI